MKKLSVLVALSVGLCAGSLIPSQAQLVGPPEPKKAPTPAVNSQGNPVKPIDAVKTQMKSSFMKLFKKEESETAADAKEGETSATAGEKKKTDEASEGGPQLKGGKPKMPARPPLLTQPEGPEAKITDPEVSKENPPPKIVTLDNPNNPFGFIDAQNKLNHATQLIEKKELTQARVILSPLRQWLVDSTEAHINLYKALNNLPTARAQAELEKELALEFAILRDRAMYQLSRIDISERNYKTAIKDLIEVVKSQPRGDIGIKAYQLLQEIGFTEKLQLVE